QDFNRAMLRDGLCAEIMKREDLDVSGYRAVATYINGEYWGIQNLRERHDKEYPAAHHDADPHAMDLLELAGWEVHEGSNESFFSLVDYLDDHDLSDPSTYAAVSSVLDIAELSNYAIAQDFLANEDWPHNNVKFWSPQHIGGKWRWFQYDFDGSLGAWGTSYTANRIDVVFSGSHQITDILQHLRSSPQFNQEFVNRYADLLNTNLAPAQSTATLQELSSKIADEVPRHLERWGQSSHNWVTDIQEIDHFLSQRPLYVRQHLATHFGLSGATYSLSLDVYPPNSGCITLTAHETAGAFTGTYFKGNPVTLRARTRPGFSFAGWADGTTSAERTIDPLADISLTAIFQHGPTGSGQAVISEIQYHASGDHDTGDWIELQNPGAAHLDISGWTLTDDDPAHSYTIPQGTNLAPATPIVIARDLIKFSTHEPLTPALGPFGFGLSNSADSVRIMDANGNLIDEVHYTDHSPWPLETDGTGRSLELKEADSDNAEADSWGASRDLGGTPAAVNSHSSQ
ncbi:MAG: CotH kinase family protein, partial [Planctomycetota bacterium]|nr:CotH kinase family protein [Planctomycetota bacterium]